MDMATISNFRDALMAANDSEIQADTSLGKKLRLSEAGGISIDYAPFEHIETRARIVIVGITPGVQQARNALSEARRALLAGQSDAEAAKAAKVFASFSGPMRSNLVAMLDHVGVNALLGIMSTAELWSQRADLVHFTSALRYPVYVGGKNYSGNPSMRTTPHLISMIEKYLAEEAMTLPGALWVPLGPAATEGVNWVVQRGLLRQDRVLLGLPHPSGANAERISYFLQRKSRDELSAKTSPDKIDAARERIRSKIASMRLN